MVKLFLKNEQVIMKGETEIVLNKKEYNISDEQLMIDNEFLKCDKCKNWFDEINALSNFHEKYDGKQYCSSCFASIE